MIDVETNQALGLEITDELVQDNQMFLPLLNLVQQHGSEEHPIYQACAVGAYDQSELFILLEL